MLQSIRDGYEFERYICSILYKTTPYNLTYYDGGPDRGRDICVQYHQDGQAYNVIVECKYYNSGVNKEVIMPALNWATVHQPALLYFWIVPYLTPAAKDFVHEFERKYKISVLIEEQINIEHYHKYIECDYAEIWSMLRQKILNACRSKEDSNSYVPEYELENTENSPFLVDREAEREELLYHSQRVFYLEGVSACGKTQLLKYVAYVYLQKNRPVFWHTIRPGNVEQQCADFFHSLARYFTSVHHDQSLLTYFDTCGFFLSQDLENLVISILKKYNPILFLDDIHNCQQENVPMQTLFKKFIKYQPCRIYFSGWFNIFSLAPDEKRNISTVFLEGLKKGELDCIIKHYSGECNPAVAELIEHRFYGLPGYAVLTDSQTTIDDINEADDFLTRLLLLLSSKEQIVLFTLSLLSTDVPGDFLKGQGYTREITSLKNKHLLINRRNCYVVHDKYRTFFSQYTIEESIQSKVTYLIEKYAILEPTAFLDLIAFEIAEKRFLLAWDVLSSNFQLLIAHQFYTQLLKYLQEIERNMSGRISINDILVKKIVLLERLSQYTLCLQYIRILDDENLFDSLDQETIFYIRLRCFYFTNQYDSILEFYKDNYAVIEKFSSRKLYIQILLIVGRVFYIRGSSKGALIFYLLAHQHARRLQERALEVKAIHRIAMIERRLGLAADSRMAFQTLLKLDALTTPKRRSYIYFRIAKCFVNEGDLDQAKEYNKESIKIKESYSDIRGLLFSDNLNAMICLKEKDYLGAYCNSASACKRAELLGLNKEWLSAAIIQLRVALCTMPDVMNSQNIHINLQRCLAIASEEKLLLRLKSIEKLTEGNWPQICLEARQRWETVESELSSAENKLLKYFFKEQHSDIQPDYETLILQKSSISRSLLLRSGFLDPLDEPCQ